MKRKPVILTAVFLIAVLLLCSCNAKEPDTAGNGDVTSSEVASSTGEPSDTTEPTDSTDDSSDTFNLELDWDDEINGGDNSVCHTVKNIKKSVYTGYLTALEHNSYELYAENKYSTNCFATYVNSDTVVNVVYTPYNKTLRVITEPKSGTALPANTAPTYTKVCEPLAISVGLASDTETTYKNGMCYIFRLEDGSFVIYDGGWDNAGNKMKEKIYAVLTENVPSGKDIVISAWVITHAHTDHIGGFMKFIRTYGKEVTVKNILLNTPSDPFCSQTDMSAKVSELKSVLKSCDGSNIIKAHPGQALMLAGARIEVLYTLDLYDSNRLDEFNTASVVTRLTVGSRSFMMTGDMTETSNTVLCEMYGSELKSDFVQVSHHGYEGGTVEFYRLVDADYVLWPSSKVGYDEMKNKDRNATFKSLNGKKLIVALDNISVITLPYYGGGVTVTPCEDYLK